jgi:hypothetical protein
MRLFTPLSALFSAPLGAVSIISLRRLAMGLFLAMLLPFLSACVENRPVPKTASETQSPALFGEGGILGALSNKQSPGIGVNSFLWRASLDVISFMPVASADPFGGVIITDWHSQPGIRNERFKLNVYILGRALRADGVRVAVFRQVQTGGGWKDSAVPKAASTKIEDAILTRARQLRHETLQLKQ